jgi:SAM-dependent methyltransferase
LPDGVVGAFVVAQTLAQRPVDAAGVGDADLTTWASDGATTYRTGASVLGVAGRVQAMTEGVDARSGVRLIGGEVDYADGSEDPVLRILEEADDRSTASDELARHISDWPTRYHLSRQRANLLRPLTLGPGTRVLDAGAGTGALARHVAETGADVVALEGTLPRARAAAARCDGLPNVEVVCGPIDAYDDAAGFDVVLCVGVLEYAGEALLPKLRALTRPDGVVVVAIENQLGLKYLLGYGEDHLGEPWAGVEGYRTPPPGTGPRTWSRRRLGGLLAQAGFPAQRWLFPFPDYKLPAVVVDEAAYAEVDAPDFVDQIVRWPCSPLASDPARVCDDRLAHRVFLEAGLGPDVANSFLVVAGHDTAAIARQIDPDVAAWFFGSDRLRLWLGSKTFPAAGDVAATAIAPTDRLLQRGWLSQHRDARQPRILGRTVEQDALAALEKGPAAVAEVLQAWRNHLRTHETDVADDAPPAHPFAGPSTRRLLPADHLDVDLGNFVAGTYVDREWRADGGVDADLVVLRALWSFAFNVVARGVRHPWPLSTTVDELAQTLARLCGTAAGENAIDRWRHAESELQAKVRGIDTAVTMTELQRVGAVSQVSPGSSRYLPFTSLRHTLARTYEHLGETCRQLEQSLQAQVALGHSVEGLQARHDQLGRDGAALRVALAHEQAVAADLNARLQAADERQQAFERRLPVRLYRRLRRLVG